jgi:sec-independent protein translocase protein TatC
MAEEDQELTFWEHLDVLRGDILRILAVIVVFGLVAFYFKEELFSIVLAQKSSDFITYRLIGGEPFNVGLMNTGLTEQFMIHMKTALFFGLLCASPYVLYVLYRFISPALYQNEKLYASKVVGSAYVMFMIGVAVNYFIIFPLTVHFLGTYQVSPEVANMLTLQSYMDTMLLMSLVFGVVFEIPVVSSNYLYLHVSYIQGVVCGLPTSNLLYACVITERRNFLRKQWSRRYRSPRSDS